MGETRLEGEQSVSVDQADAAVVYLKKHAVGAPHSEVDLRALRRKIDQHLMPCMFCCYILQFLDKVMLNVSVTLSLSGLV